MYEKNDLGRYIRMLRGKRPLREIAEKAGLSHTYISDLEKGLRRGSKKPVKPTPETLKKISDALGASYTELMVLAGYWPEEELIEPINFNQQVKENSPSYSAEKEFVDSLDLSDAEIMDKFRPVLDGEELSDEEYREMLAYIRTRRHMRKDQK